MSNNSRAKQIADFWAAEDDKWHDWDETLEHLIPGFANVPARLIKETTDTYRTYVPAVREILDDRGRYLMRDRRSNEARFKVATPEDRERVEKMLTLENGRVKGARTRLGKRIENLKQEKILPKRFDSKKLATRTAKKDDLAKRE